MLVGIPAIPMYFLFVSWNLSPVKCSTMRPNHSHCASTFTPALEVCCCCLGDLTWSDSRGEKTHFYWVYDIIHHFHDYMTSHALSSLSQKTGKHHQIRIRWSTGLTSVSRGKTTKILIDHKPYPKTISSGCSMTFKAKSSAQKAPFPAAAARQRCPPPGLHCQGHANVECLGGSIEGGTPSHHPY